MQMPVIGIQIDKERESGLPTLSIEIDKIRNTYMCAISIWMKAHVSTLEHLIKMFEIRIQHFIRRRKSQWLCVALTTTCLTIPPESI